MSAMQVFKQMILNATLRMQTLQKNDSLGSEENPIQFGNVEFWTSKDGDFCYNIPTHQWDSAKISKDLSYWL